MSNTGRGSDGEPAIALRISDVALCCSWASAKLLVSSATRPLPDAAVPRPFPTAVRVREEFEPRDIGGSYSGAPLTLGGKRPVGNANFADGGFRLVFDDEDEPGTCLRTLYDFGLGERTTTDDPHDLTRSLVASNISMLLLPRWSGLRFLNSMFQTTLTLN